MLRRPKSGDSEADLLRAQEEFLASGAQSAVRVVHRPDKRRGKLGVENQEPEAESSRRDVVTMSGLCGTDLSDQIPTLTPAPPKKSRFKDRVYFEDDDPEEQLDRHDMHITAVLSRIVEKDTSTVPVSLPAFTGAAFPKVFHRSEIEDMGQGLVPGARRSIFAQKIAAQRAREAGLSSNGGMQCAQLHLQSGLHGAIPSPVVTMETRLPLSGSEGWAGTEGSRLVSGQGLSQPDSATEALKIHQENQERLEGMSQADILEEQKRLLAHLDPQLVDFIRSHKAKGSPVSVVPSSGGQIKEQQDCCTPGWVEPEVDPWEPDQETPLMETEEDGPEPLPRPPITEQELPVKPRKEWLHMDNLETEKLEWLRDLPPPRRKGTKKAMQARFDFTGALIPPMEDLPTHLGLHHHGEEPERAGYSLQELFHLSRSQVIQQRCLALTTLAGILTKAHAGDLASSLRGSVVSSMLDAGLLFLLRFSLDDSVEGVMAAATHALHALLFCPGDEEALDSTFSWFLGMATFPLLPTAQEEDDVEDEGLDVAMKETAKEKEERKSDHYVAREDVIKGLLRMKLLPRVRYILEVMRPPPRVVLDLLEVLTRIARHSSASATQVLDCPRLVETVLTEFLPCTWTPPTMTAPKHLHGLPVAEAVKLLRVLASAGRHACARLLSGMDVRERLVRVLALEPQELLLETGQALRISTEALRLWAVAAAYGQASDLYRDLYPFLVKVLQSVPGEGAPRGSLRSLELHRALAFLTVLTYITHTAGCQQELQTGPESYQDSECPPPPPVKWCHVTDLQPSIVGWLKRCVKTLEDPAHSDSMVMLVSSQILYLGAFYSQLSTQSCFQPVECLQELESLTSEVLIPLLSHQAVRSMIDRLKSCSVLCNPQFCKLGLETVSSLPGRGCGSGSPSHRLAGPGSPLPLLTALCYLLHTASSIHRGLAQKFAPLLVSDALSGYLQACCQAMPTLSHSSAWLLRHEHHLLYLLLKLLIRLVPISTDVGKQASLYHEVTVVMLSWLLPGSEHLAYDLLATVVFNQDFIPEGCCGGPEAAQLSQLQLQDSSSSAISSLGPLLHSACAQLPSLRACYLTHLAHLEPAVTRSRDAYLGRTPYIRSWLLPELSGPVLPSNWPYLPLVSLYERMGAADRGSLLVESLPPASVQLAMHCLQWLLLLESWREGSLRTVPPAAKLAHLSCLFLCSSDLFLERPVQQLGWALLRTLMRPSQLAVLDLDVPLPGLASFQDLYLAMLSQFEAVSFGDPLFGCFLLLPLQRRFSATMRLAVFGEHVGLLRSLRVPLYQLPVPLENFTSPPEDCLPLLRLYFRSLVTGALRRVWCPVLYVVALAHLNSFIFSQDAVPQDVDTARRRLLRKAYYLTDDVLKGHLLLFKLPQQKSELGFETYDHLPPIRAQRLEAVVGAEEGNKVARD
ncbi:RNA polymerase II-associated protein 1 isoform X1 [Megalops cyprinoides]|uniref:RNA polymerase II-associated protein 1 isoform X1 n=1 Tax=Megalops cyprinoides TaxID=118141 RepID=UPI001863A377|nr:RNA polymerase II-associated protein 1 isoform X1 [Megalops cyprinoides]